MNVLQKIVVLLIILNSTVVFSNDFKNNNLVNIISKYNNETYNNAKGFVIDVENYNNTTYIIIVSVGHLVEQNSLEEQFLSFEIQYSDNVKRIYNRKNIEKIDFRQKYNQGLLFLRLEYTGKVRFANDNYATLDIVNGKITNSNGKMFLELLPEKNDSNPGILEMNHEESSQKELQPGDSGLPLFNGNNLIGMYSHIDQNPSFISIITVFDLLIKALCFEEKDKFDKIATIQKNRFMLSQKHGIKIDNNKVKLIAWHVHTTNEPNASNPEWICIEARYLKNNEYLFSDVQILKTSKSTNDTNLVTFVINGKDYHVEAIYNDMQKIKKNKIQTTHLIVKYKKK